jgi:hypothetical protein
MNAKNTDGDASRLTSVSCCAGERTRARNARRGRERRARGVTLSRSRARRTSKPAARVCTLRRGCAARRVRVVARRESSGERRAWCTSARAHAAAAAPRDSGAAQHAARRERRAGAAATSGGARAARSAQQRAATTAGSGAATVRSMAPARASFLRALPTAPQSTASQRVSTRSVTGNSAPRLPVYIRRRRAPARGQRGAPRSQYVPGRSSTRPGTYCARRHHRRTLAGSFARFHACRAGGARRAGGTATISCVALVAPVRDNRLLVVRTPRAASTFAASAADKLGSTATTPAMLQRAARCAAWRRVCVFEL